MNSGQIVTPIIKNRGNYIGNLRIRSNLVLDDLPVVKRGRDISILHSKVDFLLYITDIGILQDAVGAGINCEVTSKPEKQFYPVLFCCSYPNLLCSKISSVIFQTFPVSIVERLELWSDIEKVVGGVLHYVVDECGVRRQVALHLNFGKFRSKRLFLS